MMAHGPGRKGMMLKRYPTKKNEDTMRESARVKFIHPPEPLSRKTQCEPTQINAIMVRII